MKLKEFFGQLNFVSQCKKFRIPLWQCPQFLFLVMGIIIIGSALITYAIGIHYIKDPEIVALIVLFLTSLLLIIAFAINQSFERLAEASRMKSEFIGIVSHQLRSPLSNLKWTIEILMTSKLDGLRQKQLEYFKILKENSSRMEELIQDLLTVSRIEEGSLPFIKSEVSLEKIIKKILLGFEPFVRASNIEVNFKRGENLPLVFTDSHQVKLIIENLIDNAIRYIKAKGKIDIYLTKKDDKAYFEIKDNGVGIPKGDQKYIFRKFFRSRNALKYQTQGSGLGLFITKSIVKRLRGEIGFESKEGKGSTFWFTLPIK